MRRSSILINIWLLIILAPTMSYATEKKIDPIDKRLEECIEKDPTTAGMNNCSNDAYEEWDKVLNDVYKTLMNKLDNNTKVVLRNSQKEWVKYRDTESKFINAYYDSFQGSIYSTMNHGAHLDLVRARALKLRSYLYLIDRK